MMRRYLAIALALLALAAFALAGFSGFAWP
jgi:hypothetical protein